MALWLADALRWLADRLDPCDAHVVEMLARRGAFDLAAWPPGLRLRVRRRVRGGGLTE